MLHSYGPLYASSTPSDMSSIEQADLEAIVVDTCTTHEEAHWRDKDFRRCLSIGTKYFVKYNHPRDFWPEIATQIYISEYAQAHADSTPLRIAKVIHHFVHDFGGHEFMYLVMEYITLADAPLDLPERMTEAVRWLMGVPAPPGHKFGPLGGGPIRHRFFKDYEAPLVFSSIEALERYMEKARMLLSRLATNPVNSVSLSGERLMFMQADMDSSNFGVDEHGNTVLMDFQDVGVLPESFVAYTLSEDMITALGLSILPCLWMVGDPSLGLNEDGYPKPSTRTRRIKTKTSDS
ncbi:hypothetical protein CPB85DRAFT_1566587 [Mucidula mucida]|nr:hypothetical protein CPB85DRAFT_1566587 [Mucidula mucida]